MEFILKLLDGKKGMVASIVMTIIAYCATKGWLGEAEVALIGGLCTVFFGTASAMTRKIIYPKK